MIIQWHLNSAPAFSLTNSLDATQIASVTPLISERKGSIWLKESKEGKSKLLIWFSKHLQNGFKKPLIYIFGFRHFFLLVDLKNIHHRLPDFVREFTRSQPHAAESCGASLKWKSSDRAAFPCLLHTSKYIRVFLSPFSFTQSPSKQVLSVT